MKNLMCNLITFKSICRFRIKTSCNILCRRFCAKEVIKDLKEENEVHPYSLRKPWKSLEELADNLIENIIYNKNGLIITNKPYYVAPMRSHYDIYGLADVLQYIAPRLNYSKLWVTVTPETFMTGITVLSANYNVHKQVKESLNYAATSEQYSYSYWVVTTNAPKQLRGEHRLALSLHHVKTKDEGKKKSSTAVPVLGTWDWRDKTKGSEEVRFQYKVLRNFSHTQSSLLEIKTSSSKWHSAALFASTILFSPVLGDRYHASRINKVMETWIQLPPSTMNHNPPPLDPRLLNVLKLDESRQKIIPAHVHLRSLLLPKFMEDKRDLLIEASLLAPFDWTCRQLMRRSTMCSESNTRESNAHLPDNSNDECSTRIL